MRKKNSQINQSSRSFGKQIAAGFQICGWVRNLPDGRVKLQIKGRSDHVAQFLSEIRSQFAGQIREAVQSELDVEQLDGVNEFSIRYWKRDASWPERANRR